MCVRACVHAYVRVCVKESLKILSLLLLSNRNLKEIKVEGTFIFILKTTRLFNLLNHCIILFLFTSVK